MACENQEMVYPSSNIYPLVPTRTQLHLIHLTSGISSVKYLECSHNLVSKILTLQILCWYHRTSNLCNPYGIKNNGSRYSNAFRKSILWVKWRSTKVWEKARQSKGLPRHTLLEKLTEVSKKPFSWSLPKVWHRTDEFCFLIDLKACSYRSPCVRVVISTEV